MRISNLLSLTALLTNAVASPSRDQSRDQWYELAAIPSAPRQEHSVAAVGSDMFILGGITTANGQSSNGTAMRISEIRTTAAVQVYSITQNSWSDAAPVPINMNHINAAGVNGKLYALGGISGVNISDLRALPNSYVYNQGANRWDDLAPMPDGTARGACAVGVWGDNILLAGGLRSFSPAPGGFYDTVATVTSYNTKTGRWNTAYPPLPQPRDHVGGAVIKDTFYVVGGRDHGVNNTKSTVYALDLKNPSSGWTERAAMPSARGGLATAVIGSRIYTFGGEGDPSSALGVFNQVEVYDTKTDCWKTLSPMKVPRHGTGAVAIEGKIYIPGGGIRLGSGPTKYNDVYMPNHR